MFSRSYRWVLKTLVLSAHHCFRCWPLKPGLGFFDECWTVCAFSKPVYFLNLDLCSLNDFPVCLFQRGQYHLMTVFKIPQHRNALELRKCLFLHLLKIKSAVIQTNKGKAFSILFTVWRPCSHIWECVVKSSIPD